MASGAARTPTRDHHDRHMQQSRETPSHRGLMTGSSAPIPPGEGELRIASSEQGAPTYGVIVQLATGARQDHVIYGKAGFFGSRFSISLVTDGTGVGTRRGAGRAI